MTEYIPDYKADFMPFEPDALANWAAAEERCDRLRAERVHAMTPPLSPYIDYSSDSDYTIISYPPPHNLRPSNKNFDPKINYSASNNALVSSAPMRAQEKKAPCQKRQLPTATASGR